MRYDFDKVTDRSNVGSAKWDFRSDGAKANGIVPFTVADMEFQTAPEIMQALRESISLGIYGYTFPDEEYLEAVSGWFKQRHSYEFNKNAIAVTGGVVTALYAIVREFAKPGDGIIVQPPVYNPFYTAIRNGGCHAVENRLIYKDGAYSINFDELEALAAKPENTMMIFCSPHNPVGRVWNKDELCNIAEICARHNVLLISDEIHCDLTREKHTIISTLNDSYRKNTIVCTSTAKTFNLAGFTSANIIAENPELKKRLDKRFANEAVGGTNYFGRIATIAAYNKCGGWVDELNAYIEGNYNILRNFAAKHDRLKLTDKEGTYLAWLNLSALKLSDSEQARFMDEKALMPINPGSWFGTGGSGFIRINIAVPKQILITALNRFEEALAKFNY